MRISKRGLAAANSGLGFQIKVQSFPIAPRSRKNGRSLKPNTPGKKCRARIIGADTFSARTASNSGKAARTGCMTDFAIRSGRMVDGILRDSLLEVFLTSLLAPLPLPVVR